MICVVRNSADYDSCSGGGPSVRIRHKPLWVFYHLGNSRIAKSRMRIIGHVHSGRFHVPIISSCSGGDKTTALCTVSTPKFRGEVPTMILPSRFPSTCPVRPSGRLTRVAGGKLSRLRCLRSAMIFFRSHACLSTYLIGIRSRELKVDIYLVVKGCTDETGHGSDNHADQSRGRENHDCQNREHCRRD